MQLSSAGMSSFVYVSCNNASNIVSVDRAVTFGFDATRNSSLFICKFLLLS